MSGDIILSYQNEQSELRYTSRVYFSLVVLVLVILNTHCSADSERLNNRSPVRGLLLQGGAEIGRRWHDLWQLPGRLTELFEINAQAQEDALDDDQTGTLPPGNGRGGALAVAKPRKQRFLIRPELSEMASGDEKKGQGAATIEEDHSDPPRDERMKRRPKAIMRLWWNDAWLETTGNITSEEVHVEIEETKNGTDMSDEPKDGDDEQKVLSETPAFEEGVDAGNNDTSSDLQEEPVLDLDLDDEVECQQRTGDGPAIVIGESLFVSSGYWRYIDSIVSFGLSNENPHLRLSRHLRSVRKAAARATGFHGLLSGKRVNDTNVDLTDEEDTLDLDDEDLGIIRRRIAAIDRARRSVELKEEGSEVNKKDQGFFQRLWKPEVEEDFIASKEITLAEIPGDAGEDTQEDLENQRRKERVMEIDRLISQGQQRVLELVCEKDALQRRPNPLYNYTSTPIEHGDNFKFSRRFNFPPNFVVDDYLEDLFAHGRLIRMNHTQLWRSGAGIDDDDDESIGDDLLTPSADVSKLYQEESPKKSRGGVGNGGGGSWLLRQSIGKGGSLGMKLGELVEVSGYKAVAAAVMSALARSISGLHGINIMTHSDVRLFVEEAPDLPPLDRRSLPRTDYAQEAIKGAMLRGRKRKKKISKGSADSFLQRDAIVETLLSHCQISAPLLKLFPLAWQRALLANMITLITSVMSDFCDGIELQILGHSLTFAFKPITESDMIRHIGLAGKGFNHRRSRPAEFEAAVRATADDVSENLKFLDRWHERALGSGMLRAQVANLIARLVLTLADEVLSGARIDLWTAQAGGPRVVTGLEYRTTPTKSSVKETD